MENRATPNGRIALREYVDMRFKDMHALLNERFETQKESLKSAQDALMHRLESMNEFRRQILEERATYITRAELNLILKPLLDAHQFQKGRNWTVSKLVTIIMAAAALITVIVSLLNGG